MEELLTGPLDSLIRVAALIVLAFCIFLLRDKDNGHLIDSVSIGHPIELLKMWGLFQIIHNAGDGC